LRVCGATPGIKIGTLNCGPYDQVEAVHICSPLFWSRAYSQLEPLSEIRGDDPLRPNPMSPDAAASWFGSRHVSAL
jgi:hypothetical protein